MGRKITHEDEKSDESSDESSDADTNLTGGALGVPDASNTVDGADVALSNRIFTPPTAGRFVVGATKSINAFGGITHLHAGQIVDENNYDIEGLKRAGVVLTPYVAPGSE